MAAYSPPFTLTHSMLSRVAEIAELVGQWRFTQSSQVPMLRRENRIRTIQASLAIEHNTLSVEQAAFFKIVVAQSCFKQPLSAPARVSRAAPDLASRHR